MVVGSRISLEAMHPLGSYIPQDLHSLPLAATWYKLLYQKKEKETDANNRRQTEVKFQKREMRKGRRNMMMASVMTAPRQGLSDGTKTGRAGGHVVWVGFKSPKFGVLYL